MGALGLFRQSREPGQAHALEKHGARFRHTGWKGHAKEHGPLVSLVLCPSFSEKQGDAPWSMNATVTC